MVVEALPCAASRSSEALVVLLELAARAEATRLGEVERTLRRLSHLDAAALGLVDELSSAIVRSVLIEPLEGLSSIDDGAASALRELFGLDG